MSTKQPRASTDFAERVNAKDQERDMRPVEIIAQHLKEPGVYRSWNHQAEELIQALEDAGYAIVPVEPTDEQLIAARDWSVEKYGRGVGDDGATGCYKAMLKACK